MPASELNDATLMRSCRHHATMSGQTSFCNFYAEGGCETIDFDMLFGRAGAYAADYRSHGLAPGDTIFIVLRHRPDMLYAFVGAVLAGCIPAFLAPLSEKQDPVLYWAMLAELFATVGARAAIVEAEDLEAMNATAAPHAMRVGSLVTGRVRVEDIVWPSPQPDDIAFLQFSSGTTGLRKGVMLTHRIVMEQIETYAAQLRLGPSDGIASWLPLYHDMGLIACLITPLVTATPVTMIDAFDWLYEPALLFEVAARHGATLIWLPNFAFAHLTRSVVPAETLDLSGIRAFINCSEPCKIETMLAFATHFASVGARRDQLQTCYAMAEAVFAVAQSELGRPPVTLDVERAAFAQGRILATASGATERVRLTSTGRPLPGFALEVIDRERQPVAAGRIGEIAISGPSVFSGYYKVASDALSADGRFATGDLGFLHEGELYITGRIKDLIIAYGKNFYSHDIEAVASGIEGVKPGRAVAFGLFNEATGSEDVILVAETEETDASARKQMTRRIRGGVLDALNLSVAKIVLVEPKWLVKTSSGKLSRSANREKFLAMSDS